MRRHVATGIVLALLVGVPSAAAAASFHVFRPERFTRGTGAPRAVVRDVSVPDVAAPYTLIVRNGEGGEPVSSAVIALNGRVVVGPQDFSHAAGVIQRINHDARLDLVVLDIESRCVVTFLGVGARTFSPPACSPTGIRPGALAVGDVTGDGNEDAVTANTRPDGLNVLHGRGAGVFVPAVRSPYALAGAGDVAIGDLDGDGLADVVVATPAGVTVLINRSPF